MMKKINRNICYIVLNKILILYIHIRVWYYFIMWEGYNCRATSGPMSV